METISAEVLNEAAKRDARGRKIIGADRWRELVAAYETSGLTQAEFARREGINYHTFVAWLGRCRRPSATTTLPAARFIEATLPAARMKEWPIEVALPSGIIVRGADVAALVALLKALVA